MKAIKLTVLLLAIVSLSFGQSFEGKVVYSNTYKSKIPSLTNEQFNAMMGSTVEYLIKGGDYKTSTNGNFLQWQLYLSKDNKLYNKMAVSEAILWNDGAVNDDEIIKSEINKGVVKILGYQCDELILTCKSGVQKYYFSSKLKIDPKLFASHKFGNWSEVISRSNALPLKMIVENNQFAVESIATEVKQMKLDGKIFELPADSKLMKSPY